MKSVVTICIIGGIAALVLAIVFRLINIQPIVSNPVPGLWKVSVALLLTAIALERNK